MQHASFELRGSERVFGEGTVQVTVKEVRGGGTTRGTNWVPILVIHNMDGGRVLEIAISYVTLIRLAIEPSIAVGREDEENKEQ
jgi:hypothetical protein